MKKGKRASSFQRKALGVPGTGPGGTVAILAGGLSLRMGRDKTQLKLGRLTILDRIQRTASSTGWPVQVVRRDIVPRCGPLGGIHTALARFASDRILFLACDMPFLTAAFLQRLIRISETSQRAVFTVCRGRLGFPFILRRHQAPFIVRLIEEGRFSLKDLAASLRAKRMNTTPTERGQMLNLNTPEEWAQIRRNRPGCLRLNSRLPRPRLKPRGGQGHRQKRAACSGGEPPEDMKLGK
jgi:molybdenum cofactor guanylyltransferase